MKYIPHYYLVFILLSITSCSDNNESAIINEVQPDEKVSNRGSFGVFNPETKKDISYTLKQFSGKAEICSYELSRARYDNVHHGEAVLIFVTEPFLPVDQVKSNKGSNAEPIKVLKMNKIDRFSTGIYDYSMYTSVFTPIEKYDPVYPLKISFSCQDWCGQVFSQLNNSNGYEYSQYSYFQKEGDKSVHYDYAMLEESLFNLVRMDTALLPIGSFSLFPSQSYTRTSHIKFKEYSANASIGSKAELIVYNYEIPELKRSVRIFLDPNDQMKIVRWTETYPTVFDGTLRTSTYSLKASFTKPYWDLNSLEDNHLRDSLDMIRY